MEKLDNASSLNISVIGIGDAGVKTVNIIDKSNLNGINFICINNNENSFVDSELSKNTNILLKSKSENMELLNTTIHGKLLVNDSANKIKEAISNAQILILTAGLGGGIGTGAIVEISKIAKEMGIITICVVTTPFSYEGTIKESLANEAISSLKEVSDSVIIISNNRLINNYPDIVAVDAFKLINNVLKNCIKTFIDLVSKDSVINISISNLISLLKNKSEAYIGFGKGIGRNKVIRAINGALNSKIIERSIKNASNAILNIIGDSTITMQEINSIVDLFKVKSNNPNLNVIFNYKEDKKLRNEVQIAVIATFEKQDNKSITEQEKLLINSQELLIKVGNTLENELSGYSTGELDLQNFELDKLNVQFDDKDQRESIITNEISDEDDDIPFFLK